MKEIVSFASVLFIVAFCCSLVACTDVTGKITDTINELADTQSNYLETREINEFETSEDEIQEYDPWKGLPFSIMTDYPNGNNGAPFGCEYIQDKTGDTSISEMLSALDGISGFKFSLEMVQGLYVQFAFNPKITPAEIKDVYYIKGNNETKRYYLDSGIKIPEEVGVYDFIVSLEWGDGAKETVYFRAEVLELF